jgi:hypothetical protein
MESAAPAVAAGKPRNPEHALLTSNGRRVKR